MNTFFPEYAEIDGVEYKINTDFRVALRCLEIVDDETITDYERALAIIYLIFGFLPKKNLDIFLNKAKIFLECGKEDNVNNGEPDMDLIQDINYISSSFFSDYKINLNEEKLHFWLFINLIEGLTENSILNRVREIRSLDLNEIKDQKEREKIKKSKESVRLKKKEKRFSDEQIANINNFYKLAKLEKEV